MLNLAYYIGLNLYMIIFMVIAIATAKRTSSWIWYSIGAIIQLIALYGGHLNNNNSALDWIIYFILLLVTASIVVTRSHKKEEQEIQEQENIKINEEETNQPETTVFHNDQFSLSWAKETPQKNSMSEIAYTPHNQKKPADDATNSTPTVKSVTHNAHTIPTRTKDNKSSNNRISMVVIAILATIVFSLAALLILKIVQYNSKYNATGVSDILTVGVSADFPPYEYIDDSGDLAGVEIEMLTAISDELGLQVHFVDIPFENLFTAMENGQVDCIVGGMEYTSQRQQIANVSNTMFTDKDEFNSVIYIEKSNVDLQTAINNAILKFQKDGTFDAILDKYDVK